MISDSFTCGCKVFAHTSDVQAMLMGERKKFMGKVALTQSTLPAMSAIAVSVSVQCSDQTPCKCTNRITFMVPLTLQDYITGMNKDRHVNPDQTLHVDTLQLTRAAVQAADRTICAQLNFKLLDKASHFKLQTIQQSAGDTECLVELVVSLESSVFNEFLKRYTPTHGCKPFDGL